MLAVRLAPIKQQDNLSPEHGSKMETTTTNREAYKGARVTPAALIRPSQRPTKDKMSFEGSTESRSSFTPKPIEHVQAFRLKDNNIMSGSFSGSSGYSDEFKNRGVTKTKSFAPSYEYRKPSAKFSQETTSKKDFVAYANVRKQPTSTANKGDHWHEVQTIPNAPCTPTKSTYNHDFPQGVGMGEKANYQPPVSTLKLGKENVELSTNYKDDFTFRTQSKPKSYAPAVTFIRPGVKMDSSTEAHEKFTGQYLPPPKSFRPKYELDPNRPAMHISTNYADSYQKFHFSNGDTSEPLPRIVTAEHDSTQLPADGAAERMASPRRVQVSSAPA